MDTGLDNDLIVEPTVGGDDDDVGGGDVIRDGALHTARSSTGGFSTARSGITDDGHTVADAAFEQGCIAHVNILPMDRAASTALASLLLGIAPAPLAPMADIDQSNHVPTLSTSQKQVSPQRISKIVSLSTGYVGLIRLLACLDDNVLDSLPAAPAYTTIAAASARGLASAVFSHPGDYYYPPVSPLCLLTIHSVHPPTQPTHSLNLLSPPTYPPTNNPPTNNPPTNNPPITHPPITHPPITHPPITYQTWGWDLMRSW